MTDNDFRFKCVLFALGTILLGFGGWGIAVGCAAAYGYVILPTFRFIQAYLAVYGRVTAELGSGGFLIVISLIFYDRMHSSLVQGLAEHLKEIEVKRTNLQTTLNAELTKTIQLLNEKALMEKRFWTVEHKNRALISEIESLRLELERITEPEKLADKQKQEEQAEANETLREHLGQTQWRTRR